MYDYTSTDPYYYNYYQDAGQSYIDNYANQPIETPVDPAATGGGGVAGTLAGLAGTGAGYYGISSLFPGTAAATTGATLAGGAGAMTPVTAMTMTPATPWAGLPAANSAAGMGAGFGTAAGLAGVAAPLIAGQLYQNFVTDGRSNYEKEKDPFRDQLVESGFLTPDFKYNGPNGSYDFGVSGGAKPQADLNDPIQANIFGQAQGLVQDVFQPQFDNIDRYHQLLDRDVAAGYGLFGGPEDAVREGKRGYAWADNRRNAQNQELTNDMASYFTGAATQGAPDLTAANANFQAIADALNYHPNKDKKDKKK